MGSFSSNMRRVVKKNNHPLKRADKRSLRRAVMAALGAVQVFDAFAGSGRMHRDVYREAAFYVGCDLRWYFDERLAFVADNRRVLRAIDLDAFNLFDLDAYGSPWEQALIIAARRRVAPGERIGICLTDGSMTKLKMGQLPNAMREIAHLHGDPSGLARVHGEILDRAIDGLAKRMRCTIEARWDAQGKTASRVRYVGLVLCGADQ